MLTGSVAFVVLGVAAEVGGRGRLVRGRHGEENSGGRQGVGIVVWDDDDGADQGSTAGGSALIGRWIWVKLCCGLMCMGFLGRE